MSHEIIIAPYQGANEGGRAFTFGMTSAQLSKVDKRVFHVLQNHSLDWTLERRSGYSTELVAGKLVSVNCRFDPSHNHIVVDGEDFSSLDAIERAKSTHDHYLYADGESVLFPELGVLYSVTPFREGFEAPRPGVLSKEVIAFSKERLEHYRNASRVLTVQPLAGIRIAGGTPIRFDMTRTQVRELWGTEELLWDEEAGAHREIQEYRFAQGLSLTYRRHDSPADGKPLGERSPLYCATVMERNGWQVEVEGIRIFQDDNLARMTETYEHIDSKKGKATAFPSLGILTVGCGKKKNTSKGAGGKYVIVSGAAFINRCFVDIWD
jgi:hypothetical protein